MVDFKNVEKNDQDVVKRSHVPRQPWRDIACQVFGAVATDVGRHFIERWSHARRLQGCVVDRKEAGRLFIERWWSHAKKFLGLQGDDNYDTIPALELQAPDRKIIIKFDERNNKIGKESISDCTASVAAVFKELETTNTPPQMSPIIPLTSCQILRSVSRWSGGTRHESSIHAAYCSLIENAEQFVYIENQFFASAVVDGDHLMGNRIAAALCSRIVRAIRKKEKFRVVVVMPLFPGFAGEVETESGNSGPLLTVMHWQYRTICRGENSILAQIQNAIREYKRDVTPGDFIQFYSLRNWSTMGTTTETAANENGKNNHEEEQKNSFQQQEPMIKTENVYVHSKCLNVDDVHLLVGSANINDRSMLGNRDSEMCMLMEDKTKHFGKTMRSSTMMEFFGDYETNSVSNDLNYKPESQYIDWMNDEVWSKMIAHANKNTKTYRDILLPLPDDTIKTWKELKRLRKNRSFDIKLFSPDQMKASNNIFKDVVRMKNDIKGIIVKFPLEFLADENLQPSVYSNTMGSLAPSIFN